MEEEKPRHQRILDRLASLVDERVKKISIGGEGGLTVQQIGSRYLMSGSSAGSSGGTLVPARYNKYQPPLRAVGNEFAVVVGTVDSMILTLDGTGIYGDGDPGSIPLLPSDNAEIWAQLNISPTGIFEIDPGPPQVYAIGNMSVTSGQIVRTPLNTALTETKIQFTLSSGGFTPGQYSYWICSIIDGAVVLDLPSFSTRYFLPSGIGSGNNYGALTVGMWGTGGTTPDVDYI